MNKENGNKNIKENITKEKIKEKQEKYTKDIGGATLNEKGKIVRVPATKDFMFKNLFGVNGREENLKGLLEAILKTKIEKIQIQNPELPRDYQEAKLGILDVRAKLEDGTIAAIEMQVRNQRNMGERITFYASKLYINTIESGEMYNDINKIIAITITNFNYFTRKEYHQIAHLKFEECLDKNEIVREISEKIKNGEESDKLTDRFEVHTIDLVLFKKMENPQGDLADWLNLIIGNEGEIEMAVKRNEKIAKANKDNKALSATKEMQDIYWLEKMAEYDYNTNINVATKEGFENGKIEGEKSKQLEIAKKMKEEKFDRETIKRITNLTAEEIEKL